MNSFTQSLQDSLFIASIFIAALFVICTVSLALRNYEIRHELKKLKKWRKFSEIEKKQKHEDYDALATELAEERAFNDTQGSIHVRLMLKYSGIQEESDKLKKELKIAQTCLKVAETEITELKSKLERKRNERGQFVKKSDRDWTTATKEELLAEAKRRYPVGTKYLDVLDSESYISEVDPLIDDGTRSVSIGIWVNNGGGYIYADGKWAQILPA